MRVCAGGLLVRGDRILLARRADDRVFYPGVWDVHAELRWLHLAEALVLPLAHPDYPALFRRALGGGGEPS